MSSPEGPLLFRRAGLGLPRRELKLFAQQLESQVTEGRTYSCLLTDDRELRRLNKQFLGHDYPTDVLSFPSLDEHSLGELAISTQRAREQAESLGHEWAEEIKILMLHGVLHLLGMDHEKDRGKMARTEKIWRKKFSLPTGLIERARA